MQTVRPRGMRSIRIAVPTLRRKRSTDHVLCLARGNNRSGCRTDSGQPQPQEPCRGSPPPGHPEPAPPGVRSVSPRICRFCDLVIASLPDHFNEHVDKSLNANFCHGIQRYMNCGVPPLTIDNKSKLANPVMPELVPNKRE